MSRHITYEEVSKHNDKNSVWMVIHGNVYDVTSFLEEHPGGEETLLDVAGQDGTQEFDDVGHSEDAKELLKKYKIGSLAPGEVLPKKRNPQPDCCRNSQSKCSLCSGASQPPPTPLRCQSSITPRRCQSSTTPPSPRRTGSPLSSRPTPTPHRCDKPKTPPPEPREPSPEPSRPTPTPHRCGSYPTPERRVQSIVVPRERRPQPPCDRHAAPESSSGKWKYVLALAGAILIGVALKKYLATQ